MARKGIILAGGTGSRLWPVTKSVSKQLLPIYDKPMVYYPLSLLMRAQINDVLLISTPHEQNLFTHLLGDGSKWGMNIQYAIQPSPDGLAQAFTIGEDFIGDDCVSLVLGDNIFYGGNLMMQIDEASVQDYGATVFAHRVNNPENYGVVEFDELDRVISLEEKPENPKSNYAVTGLYFYDNDVIEIAKSITPSERGELEITSVNNVYLENEELRVAKLSRGCTWFDAGTFDNMLQISNYIETIQKRQGQIIASPDEIAYRNGWITFEELIKLINSYGKSLYAKQLYESVLED
jgi:glucose-1-phosphate thymidylyltransferase